MPLPQHIQDEMIERHAAAEKVTARLRLLAMARTLLLCWTWAGLGIFLILWSAHTTDVFWGTIAFWGGLAAGNGGVLFTLIGAWRAADERGDNGPPT